MRINFAARQNGTERQFYRSEETLKKVMISKLDCTKIGILLHCLQTLTFLVKQIFQCICAMNIYITYSFIHLYIRLYVSWPKKLEYIPQTNPSRTKEVLQLIQYSHDWHVNIS